MSIIHVTDCFLPRLGGIEVQVAGLADAQSRAGARVHVVTATRDAEQPPGYTVHRVAMRLPGNLPVHPRAGSHLDRLLADVRPEVVYVHVGAVSPFAWSGISSALRSGLPTVAVVHSMWDPLVQRIYRRLDRWEGWCRGPLVWGAVSTAAAERMRAALPGAEVSVVPNGITPVLWRGVAEQRPDDALHVVSVGRLASRKQPMHLLSVLREAREQIGDLRATVVGAGPQMPAMRRYLRRHGMDWVTLPGRLDREAIRRLLSGADVFVNPTVAEAFGLAALEARTAGVPVIARPGTGVADFVRDGVEGLLSDDLVGALVRLAGDHEERRRIAAHNRDTDPPCTWPRVLEALRACRDRAVHAEEAAGRRC
ncbi:glycosyltransferase involved in cell wall biosynthesis [Saccharothrix tamanrassetensis]|uniref:Glycosyltransferase involved in cell wall biosynthesis n=1 Tax=Saccharothrix tamanrassetensis TaxID=1051531 RepID=A0A841CD21_9PSEU|nr:glycosyltransferase family 4 protein [Saccharothrix tamanrassetensis]MBB5954880.1 glycosyltransferase involved in cell wall biosynthesis [Saccharothrix tamanrassetensis]